MKLGKQRFSKVTMAKSLASVKLETARSSLIEEFLGHDKYRIVAVKREDDECLSLGESFFLSTHMLC
jgi:hypothetical protein